MPLIYPRVILESLALLLVFVSVSAHAAMAADSSLCEPQPLYAKQANFNGMVCWSGLGCGGGTGKLICKGECFDMPGQPDCGQSTSIPIPGSGSQAESALPQDLGGMVQNIINLALLVSGMLAFGAVIYGAFMYTFSAGNPGMQSDARDQITQAFLGLALLMGAYLILNTINPALTEIKFPKLPTIQGPKVLVDRAPGSGSCEAIPTGTGSPANLATAGFGANAEIASRIANKESGGNAAAESGTDKCADGKSFSIGLFQINMIVHAANYPGCQAGIFNVSSQPNCSSDPGSRTGPMPGNPGGYCIKYNCRVVDTAKYETCLTAMKNPQTNIAYAVQLSRGGTNWDPWRNSKLACISQ